MDVNKSARFLSISRLEAASLVILALISYYALKCIYLLYYHPLARFPGPLLASMSDLWISSSIATGRHPFRMVKLHQEYGDVVRIGPNWLSFATPQAYQDIYGRPSQGKKLFLKFAEFERPGDISTTRDPDLHSLQKRALSKGFSAAALRDQEVIVQQYADLLVRQLGSLGKGGKVATNIGEALNWFTFDVIGDLAFGEPFHALLNGSNHMISLITDALRYSGVIFLRRQRPYVGPLIARLLFPRHLEETHLEYQKLADEKSAKRIVRGDLDRQDFFSHLIRDHRITKEELMATAWTLIMAGSETTATALTATIFYLLRTEGVLQKLRDEVCTKFDSSDQINDGSTKGLEYLSAVIEEGLRLFPPLALGLPRESPGAVIDGHYVPPGVCVSAENFSLSYDSRFWIEPQSFKPERWIGAGIEGDNKAAHVPFSEGPRSCIGKSLAYVEMRLILAKLVWHFDWVLASTDLDDWNQASMCYALWKMPKLMVEFHPRQASSVY
ncbi:hypothetical protein JX266_013097 [Neoarthrinium moseri]|nr:hypothetical protein JX266_013097 [Neoarthrinium moseri]